MPCWYYDKKELRNTPSARDGIDYITEARYRKEGARFIIDCGTKLGLRYDSCATGVVFFHRFYMFHSFKEFHRYVTAACCLFLAGKTEETPKKCKDLIKTTRSMLTDAQFAVFGEDPKEEVMTLERILLQTIKFDLMVEHPYAYLLKFAKLVKGRGSVADKAKVQKLVQMAWTFINDSMCTTLCLQWEPEVIAVSLMYLATRLNKTEITDWIGKPPGFKGKWWESLVEDVNQELLEDVCHQVLDLYQPSQAVKAGQDETPPQASNRSNTTSSAVTQTAKRPRSPPPAEPSKPRGPVPNKVPRDEKRPVSPARSTNKDHNRALKSSHSLPAASSTKTSHSGPSTPASAPVLPTTTTVSNYSQNNPYMSQQMYSSSFMSQEGSQSIQSLVGGRTTYSGTTNYTQPPTASVPAPPTTSAYSQPPTYQQSSYQGAGYQQPPPQPPNFQQPPPTVTGYSQPNNYSQSYTYPPPTQPAYSGSNQYQTPPPNYNQNYTGQYGTAQQYPANYQYNSQSYQNFAPSQSYQQPQTPQPPPPGMPPHIPPPPRPTTALPSVRITGRPS